MITHTHTHTLCYNKFSINIYSNVNNNLHMQNNLQSYFLVRKNVFFFHVQVNIHSGMMHSFIIFFWGRKKRTDPLNLKRCLSAIEISSGLSFVENGNVKKCIVVLKLSENEGRTFKEMSLHNHCYFCFRAIITMIIKSKSTFLISGFLRQSHCLFVCVSL